MTTAIAIIATISTTAEHKDRVQQALASAASDTVHEPGCEQYALHVDAKDPHRFVMIERWADQTSLDAHAKAPPFQRLAAVLDGRATLQVQRCLPVA